MSKPAKNVVVVGGGWAGLAAAVELTRAGIPVTLYESARQLGGRARCVRFGDARVDNGQHIMIGAYRQLLSLLQKLGLAENRILQRRPLSLELTSLSGDAFHMQAPNLPAPFHLLLALLTARGLSMKDRLAAVRFGRYLSSATIDAEQDISVQALLVSQRQTPTLIQHLWEPLCIAALNTPVRIASARIFLRVLRETFDTHREHSDLLLPTTDLGSAFPEPALHFIERHGGKVILNQRVTGLRLDDDGIRGITLGDHFVAASQLVLAVNPVACQRLLSPFEPFTALTRDLARLENQPITTVYLRYPESVALAQPMLGILHGTAQWLFDRGLCGQAGFIAVVISAEGAHMDLDNAALTNAVTTELATLFPHWPSPLESMVIREKRATFASCVGVDRLRPAIRTPVAGCWLAGDFTDTGLPATLEGAVASGQACATGILEALSGEA